MDPNETLQWLREVSNLGVNEIDPDAFRERFNALDDWLSKGGFLPKDWAFKTSPGGGCPHHDDEEECS